MDLEQTANSILEILREMDGSAGDCIAVLEVIKIDLIKRIVEGPKSPDSSKTEGTTKGKE